jgi:hypothetical protein
MSIFTITGATLGWSSLDDSSLRPSLLVLRDGSNYRVANPVDFGSGAGGSSSIVGISGSNGTTLNILSSGGFNNLVGMVQGIVPSGFSGTLPHPLIAGGVINTSGTGSFTNNTVQHSQLDGFGNNWVSLGTALSELVDSIATRPLAPLSNGTYGINITGTGVFSNYSGTIPTVVGNSVRLSIESDNSNNGPVYYSFSSSAVTGDAFKIQDVRTFETTSNLNVFFAQTTGAQRVMVHYQSL